MKNPQRPYPGTARNPRRRQQAPTATMVALANIIPIGKAQPPINSQPNGSNANKENLNER